jgi:hypothetical protein
MNWALIDHFTWLGIQICICWSHTFFFLNWDSRWASGSHQGISAFKLPSIKCNCVHGPIAYAFPYHIPTATVDISKPLAHTTPYKSSVVVRPVGHAAKVSKMTEADYGREINITFPGNSSGGQSACQLHAPLTWDICGIVLTKWQIFVAFIFPRPWYTCVMIMLFNLLLDMPHQSCGWIILAKNKCSLTRI